MDMFVVTLACRGVPPKFGPAGALDVTEEFSHRPWHQNVRCEWDGNELILRAETEWDADGKALLDEFSDAISACIPGEFDSEIEVKSITNLQGKSE